MRECVCAHVNDSYIMLGEDKVMYSSLFTKEFYEYADSIANNYKYGFIVDNVLYLYYFQKLLSIEWFFKKKCVDTVYVNITDYKLYIIIMTAVNRLGLECRIIKVPQPKLYIHSQVVMVLVCIFLFLVQLLQIKKIEGDYKGKDLWITRTDAARNRIFDIGDVVCLDERKVGQGSLYKNLPIMLRFKLIYKAYIKANKTLHRLRDECLGDMPYMLKECESFCAKRLVSVYFFGGVLESNLCLYEFGDKIYSSNFIDGYSQIEQWVAMKCNKRLIVIPHGLEDSFIYPAGCSGDVFYVTSKFAEKVLNKKYKTNKFIFNERITWKSFYKKINKRKRRIVYFTDGTGNVFDIKIVRYLNEFLKNNNFNLYIKYHGGEKLEMYHDIDGIIEENNINEAIAYNICIARGSTVLLEAVYNNSVSIQVIMDGDGVIEADTIPSLHDSRIIKADGLDELGKRLSGLIKAI